jgi:hypothetical protein
VQDGHRHGELHVFEQRLGLKVVVAHVS